MQAKLISSTRYLILIAVAGVFIAATTLLLYGAGASYELVVLAIGGAKGAKGLVLAAIELVDLFLLATVLYVIAIGLYELFINDNLLLPAWLEIHNLDDLKEKLIGVIIVVLAVFFLGQVISWDGQRDLLGVGGAIAVMIAALTYFASQKKSQKNTRANTTKAVGAEQYDSE